MRMASHQRGMKWKQTLAFALARICVAAGVALYATHPVVCLAMQAAPASSAAATDPGHVASQKPVVLDRVIAIINGDVVLESDVRDEIHFAVLQPLARSAQQNTRQQAMERLINRVLIKQQIEAQQQNSVTPTEQEVDSSIHDLKKLLPACVRYKCDTEEGWLAFLKDNGFTEQEVRDRWRQRLVILRFIDVRFRAGIRVSRPEIEDYYKQRLLPEFEREKTTPPSLDSISARVEEIVLQQKVNGMLQDWLKSLKEQGSVQILDPALNQSAETEKEGGAK